MSDGQSYVQTDVMLPEPLNIDGSETSDVIADTIDATATTSTRAPSNYGRNSGNLSLYRLHHPT